MKRFLPYFTFLRPVSHLFVAALLFGVIHGVASGFGLPFATEKVFPKLFGNRDPSMWVLVASVAILPAAFLVRGLAGYFNTYLMTFCGIQVLKGIQLRVYRKIQSLPLEFFHARKSGDLLARVLGDTAVLQQTLTITANDLIKQPITFLGAVGAVIYFSLKHHELAFVLICLAIIPVLVLPIRYTGNKLLKKSRQLQDQGGGVYNLVQENLLARTDVRLFNLQESQVAKFKTQVELVPEVPDEGHEVQRDAPAVGRVPVHDRRCGGHPLRHACWYHSGEHHPVDGRVIRLRSTARCSGRRSSSCPRSAVRWPSSTPRMLVSQWRASSR